MKQVNPKYYNHQYFESGSNSPKFLGKTNLTNFHKKYLEISSLVPHEPTDHVCDYGCGNGDLSFLLYLRYHCSVTAIDYSSNAISICQSKLTRFKKNVDPKATINFLNKNNQELPKLKNIKTVYFCDVFEHLYPHEIKYIIKQISKWGNPNIVVHTDNNMYLKYVSPFFQLIALLTKKVTLKELRQQSKFNQNRHVNLTNPRELKKTMEQFGYHQSKLEYPAINTKTIKIQLGSLSRYKFLINISRFFVSRIPFLSPSFYALYKK